MNSAFMFFFVLFPFSLQKIHMLKCGTPKLYVPTLYFFRELSPLIPELTVSSTFSQDKLKDTYFRKGKFSKAKKSPFPSFFLSPCAGLAICSQL